LKVEILFAATLPGSSTKSASFRVPFPEPSSRFGKTSIDSNQQEALLTPSFDQKNRTLKVRFQYRIFLVKFHPEAVEILFSAKPLPGKTSQENNLSFQGSFNNLRLGRGSSFGDCITSRKAFSFSSEERDLEGSLTSH